MLVKYRFLEGKKDVESPPDVWGIAYHQEGDSCPYFLSRRMDRRFPLEKDIYHLDKSDFYEPCKSFFNINWSSVQSVNQQSEDWFPDDLLRYRMKYIKSLSPAEEPIEEFEGKKQEQQRKAA